MACSSMSVRLLKSFGMGRVVFVPSCGQGPTVPVAGENIGWFYFDPQKNKKRLIFINFFRGGGRRGL